VATLATSLLGNSYVPRQDSNQPFMPGDPMNAQSRFAAVLLALTTALVAVANAQAQDPASNAAPSAASHSAVTPPAAKPAAAETTTHAKKHASHAKTPATHKPMAQSAPPPDRDTAYRMALKQCVQGPATQKDSCIDSAIVRFGHA
jgi:hypothetical protein